MIEAGKKLVKTLPTANLQTVEQARYAYLAKVPEHVTEEELLEPVFWSHVASRLPFRTRIEVWAIDGTWFQELVVYDNQAHVAPIGERIRFLQGTPEEAAVPEGFSITHRGPELLWVVDRNSDSKRLHQGASSKADALKWLADYRKAGMKKVA